MKSTLHVENADLGVVITVFTLALMWCTETAFAAAAGVPSLAGRADQGVFRLYVNDDVYMSETFTWESGGNYRADYELSMAGQTVMGSLEVTCDSTGAWTSMS